MVDLPKECNKSINYQKMKILVIGGSGYIGTAFIKKMLDDGYLIRCLDRHMFNKYCMQNLNDQLNRFEVIVGDIRKEKDLQRGLKDIDAIVNFAAIVGSPSCAKNPEEAWSVNVNGAQLLSKLTPSEIPIVQLSTCSVYGKAKKRICSENDPTNPLTIYGETKLLAEKAILEHNGVILRSVTAYGPSQTLRYDLFLHTLIYFWLKNIKFSLFEPYAIRPMIYIEDLVRAIQFCLINYNLMHGNIYNIGSDNEDLTKLELVKKVSALTGLQFDINQNQSDPDGRDYSISWDKIKNLGFKLDVPIDIGLGLTIDWLNQEFSNKS